MSINVRLSGVCCLRRYIKSNVTNGPAREEAEHGSGSILINWRGFPLGFATRMLDR